MKRWRLLAVIAPVLLWTAVNADDVVVRIASDAPEAIREAANDLAYYIGKAASLEVSFADAQPPGENPVILVGLSPDLGGDLLPDEDLGPEAFSIKRKGEHVVIAGRHPVATANGVYYFIEKYLGVHWFIPGPIGDCVPKDVSRDFLSRVADEEVAPACEPRTWSDSASYPSWKEWHRRNRLPSPPTARWVNFKNYRQSMLHLPADKYGKSHSEYYPLVDGKRLVPEAKFPAPSSWNWEPCYSNEAVRRIYVEEALRFFDEHPEVPSFEMGLDDAEVFCRCDACRALDGDVDAFAQRNFSNRYYWFLKQVADAVAETHPDRLIGTLVYAQTRTLPDNMDRLPDNVFAYLADTGTHASQWWNKDVKNKEQAHRREWARRVSHLGRYEYYGLDWWMPRYYPHLLDEEIKFDRNLGFGSEYAEIYALRTHLAPMLWAVTRLYWDATLDMDDLLDTFFTGMFGDAAQPMKRYWEGLEDAWVNRDPSIAGNGWRDLETQAKLFTPQRLDAL
ncbi:MAG: DUF4838 domain-containing protein, partial [Planctomycetota bacterium]